MTIHKMTGTKFYITWISLNQRCKYKKNYKNISVCERWLVFENFMDDMYKPYLKHKLKYGENNTTIDRIDNNGNYCKSNCRWATPKIQANNRNNNRILDYNELSLTVSQWAEKLSVKQNTLHTRLGRGWSIKRTLTQPVDYTKSNRSSKNQNLGTTSDSTH